MPNRIAAAGTRVGGFEGPLRGRTTNLFAVSFEGKLESRYLDAGVST